MAPLEGIKIGARCSFPFWIWTWRKVGETSVSLFKISVISYVRLRSLVIILSAVTYPLQGLITILHIWVTKCPLFSWLVVWRSRGLIKIQNGAFGGYKSRRSLAVFPLWSWTWRKVGETFKNWVGLSHAPAFPCRHLVSVNLSSSGTY